MRYWFLLIPAIVAAALWLEPASLYLVDWQGPRAEIVGVFAPFERIWWMLVLTTAVSILWHVSRAQNAPRTLSSAVGPFALFGLWILPFAPAAASLFPLLMIFAGPVRWLVAIVASLRLAGRLIAPLFAGFHVAISHMRLRWSGAITAAFVFILLGWHVTSAIGPTGDEPHYLVIAQSLLADADVRVENNYAERQYRSFYRGALRPHYGRPGLDGSRYSVHAPGTAVAILPGYALAGYPGAVVTMAIITAGAVFLIYLAALGLTAPLPALAAASIVGSTVPLSVHSWMVYPEVPATLVVAWVTVWLLGSPVAERRWLLRGTILSILPWLHVKFLPLLCVATLILLTRMRFRSRAAIALCVPVVMSGLLWVYSTHVMYGLWNPIAPYLTAQGEAPLGSGVGTSGAPGLTPGVLLGGALTLLRNIPRGVMGLLFDQEFGLLTFSPVFVLAIPGWWRTVRDRSQRWIAVVVFGLAVSIIATVASFEMWWGGASAPARFLLPVVPLAAPMIAVTMRDGLGATARPAVSLLIAFSVMSFLVMVARPSDRLMFDDHDGWGQVIEHLQGPAPVSSVLPTFVAANWTSQLPIVGAWVLAAMIGGITLIGLRRLRSANPFDPYLTTMAGVVAFLCSASLLTSMAVARSRREVAVQSGRLRLMNTYEGGSQPAMDVGRWTRLTDSEIMELCTIELRPGRGASTREVSGPLSLPKGHFMVRAWIDWQGQSGSEVLVVDRGSREVIGRVTADRSNPVSVSFTIASAASDIVIVASNASLARQIWRLEVVPLELAPRLERSAPNRIRSS